MFLEFSSGQDAARYVNQSLAERFAVAWGEVVPLNGVPIGQGKGKFGRVPHLAAVIEKAAGPFPRAVAQFNSEASDGLVAQIWCQCDDEEAEACPRHCEGLYGRPSIAVMLISDPETERRPGAARN